MAVGRDLEGAEAMIRVAESALLVPVPAAEPLVHEHRLAHDPVAPLGIPAHITLLYPFVPPDGIDAAVERAVAEVVAGFDAFDFTLRDVRSFADGVVYLAPEPEQPFTALTAAFGARWPEHPPYGGGYDTVIPHLTVAMANAVPVNALETVLRANLPVSSRATEVWLMEGRVGDGWVRRAAFPLTQT
jgi:2'-5' RNA ligase